MLLLFGIVGIACIVIDCVFDIFEWFFRVFGILVVVISFCFSIFLIDSIADGKLIDSKIQLFEEENIQIQGDVSIIVNNYLDHEKTVYESITPDNIIFFASIYPELKSNELVQQQINVYINNNNNIRNLKLKKINISKYKWWLYFGK